MIDSASRLVSRPHLGWLPRLLLFAQVGFLFWTRLAQPDYFFDDAFTHFRNALNLVEGRGFVYNEGDYLIGTTSPVWALMLAAGYGITGIDVPLVAKWLNFGIDLWLLLALLGLTRRFGIPLLARHIGCFLIMAEPYHLIFSQAGMEMSAFCAALLLTVHLLAGERWIMAGLLLGILGWLRPEGAVVWMAAAATLLLQRQWTGLKQTFATAIPIALLAALALLLYFGTFIPQSLLAKKAAPWFNPPHAHILLEMWLNVARLGPLQYISGFEPSWGIWSDRLHTSLMAMVNLVTALLGVAFLMRRRFRTEALMLSLFLGGLAALFGVSNPVLYLWYNVPIHFSFLLLSLLGWWGMALKLGIGPLYTTEELSANEELSAKPNKPLVRRAGYPLLLSLYLLGTALSFAVMLNHIGGQGASNAWRGLLFQLTGSLKTSKEWGYIGATRSLQAWQPDQTNLLTIGTPEIGITGYSYSGPIFDLYGLVTEEALEAADQEILKNLPENSHHFPVNVIMLKQPPLLLAAAGYIPDIPPEFWDIYHLIDDPHSNMKVFVRQDVTLNLPPGVERQEGPPEERQKERFRAFENYMQTTDR